MIIDSAALLKIVKDSKYLRYTGEIALQNRAHNVVRKARLMGLLPPASTFPCIDCNGVAYGYDHRDYSKPLEVDPICRSCNVKRGKARGH